MITSHPLVGKLDIYVGYTKDNIGNEQSDEQLTGKIWTKKIVMQRPSQGIILAVGANNFQDSSASARVYIDDKLEAGITQQATTMPAANLSLVNSRCSL